MHAAASFDRLVPSGVLHNPSRRDASRHSRNSRRLSAPNAHRVRHDISPMFRRAIARARGADARWIDHHTSAPEGLDVEGILAFATRLHV
jgi:hypothetical protein